MKENLSTNNLKNNHLKNVINLLLFIDSDI